MIKWSEILPEDVMQIADKLTERVDNELSAGEKIYPPKDQIFRALQLTPPENTKVVIIGQDPYHTPGQANGLAFSINNGNPVQPSLQNIFAELCTDIPMQKPTTSDLTPWAEQGVLLLNSVLTVYEHRANSHVDWGWQEFTKAILQTAVRLPQPIVFILWGAYAVKTMPSIPKDTANNKLIIKSTHPSPLSATKGTYTMDSFIGSKPFSRANAFLTQMGKTPVNWKLP